MELQRQKVMGLECTMSPGTTTQVVWGRHPQGLQASVLRVNSKTRELEGGSCPAASMSWYLNGIDTSGGDHVERG